MTALICLLVEVRGINHSNPSGYFFLGCCSITKLNFFPDLCGMWEPQKVVSKPNSIYPDMYLVSTVFCYHWLCKLFFVFLIVSHSTFHCSLNEPCVHFTLTKTEIDSCVDYPWPSCFSFNHSHILFLCFSYIHKATKMQKLLSFHFSLSG